jgi:hypothetical protein
MAKAPDPPVAPAVAAVFTDFLTRLEADEKTDAAIIERIRQRLGEQKFDADSLRAAMFDPIDPSKS